jgi:serine O-acetyltransferase
VARDALTPAIRAGVARAATLTWTETRARMRADRARLEAHCAAAGDTIRPGRLAAPRTCVALYRVSRFCYARGWRARARLLWQLNLWLTGADLSPLADLGPGLVVIHPVAVTLVGSAGRDLTVEGWGGLGGGLELRDVGAGPGLPLLGDSVRLAHGAMVLGAVRIGDRATIGAGCTVTDDVPADHVVSSAGVRVLRGGRPDGGPAPESP